MTRIRLDEINQWDSKKVARYVRLYKQDTLGIIRIQLSLSFKRIHTTFNTKQSCLAVVKSQEVEKLVLKRKHVHPKRVFNFQWYVIENIVRDLFSIDHIL